MDPCSTDILHKVIIDPGASVTEALARMDQAETGALVLCRPGNKMVGILTDGDIRRALLKGVSMEDPCETIAIKNPTKAVSPISAGEAMYIMSRHDIAHLPVVDEHGTLLDFLLRKDLATEEVLRESASRRLDSVIIPPDISISEAISRMDEAETGGMALCTVGRRLRGVLTDGDVRRAVLRGVSLEEPCESIAVKNPIHARAPISAAEALHMMTRHDIAHLPVVDDEGALVEFLLRRDLIQGSQPNLSAVIMAGGFGTRLLPLTEQLPKPMLPVGDRPLLERTIQQLRRSGIRDVSLTTHYLHDRIVQHFGDGEAFGVRINYSNEGQPLGTAGGLRLMERPTGPFLVINGDILTGVSFQEMLCYHQKYAAVMTVGVRKYEVTVPFGVVECDDVRITELQEKPSLTLFINAGVYLLEPVACDYIPEGQRFDMTDLIRKLLDEGRAVVSFPIVEYWQDVGRFEDYQQAQDDACNGRI